MSDNFKGKRQCRTCVPQSLRVNYYKRGSIEASVKFIVADLNVMQEETIVLMLKPHQYKLRNP